VRWFAGEFGTFAGQRTTAAMSASYLSIDYSRFRTAPWAREVRYAEWDARNGASRNFGNVVSVEPKWDGRPQPLRGHRLQVGALCIALEAQVRR